MYNLRKQLLYFEIQFIKTQWNVTPFPRQSGLRSSTEMRLPGNSQWQKVFERYIRFRAYLISPKITPSKSGRSKTLSHYRTLSVELVALQLSHFEISLFEKPRVQLQFLNKHFALFWRRVVNQQQSRVNYTNYLNTCYDKI